MLVGPIREKESGERKWAKVGGGGKKNRNIKKKGEERRGRRGKR